MSVAYDLQHIQEEEAEEPLFPRRVRKREIVYVTSQLAIMAETGLTLSAALDGIAAQEENPTLRKTLLDLKVRVEGGEDFSVALTRHPKLFDNTFIALIRASEHTGELAEMLDRIANYQAHALEGRSKVRAAMAYPAAMLVIAVAVTIFLLTYVMPKFEPLFSRNDAALPKPTVVLLSISKSLTQYWPWWVGATAAAAVAAALGSRTPEGRKIVDWCKINTPIIGPMMRRVIISRSIRTLGAMVKAGVSMLDAIQLSSDVTGNYYYEQVWKRVKDEVTNGNRIHDALFTSSLFPRTLVQMIASGEETGKLDQVLEKVSDHYDKEVEVALKTATSLIEPLLITVMGIVVGGIGLSLLLPIFSLSRMHS